MKKLLNILKLVIYSSLSSNTTDGKAIYVHVIKEQVGVRTCLQVDFGHWGSNIDPLDWDLNTRATVLGTHDKLYPYVTLRYNAIISFIQSESCPNGLFSLFLGIPNASLN